MCLYFWHSTENYINATHLHKTSHKLPNIKFQKIAFYLKMSKSVIFCFHQNNIFGQESFKIFAFHIILLEFSCIYGYFENSFK